MQSAGILQGDPVLMRRANGWAAIVWVVMIPVAISTGLIDPVQ